MKEIKRKRIRIPYNGVIDAKGGVYGPITSPYLEDLTTIQHMLLQPIPVLEVVGDKEIPLTLSNINSDFTTATGSDPAYVPPRFANTANIKIPVPSDFNSPPQNYNVNNTNKIKNGNRTATQKPDAITEK